MLHPFGNLLDELSIKRLIIIELEKAHPLADRNMTLRRRGIQRGQIGRTHLIPFVGEQQAHPATTRRIQHGSGGNEAESP